MQQFMREFPAAVLLGGWATYLRTGADKSHGIDVIVDHMTLGLLSARYALSPSSHVGGRKFQMELDGVEVDVYPVYQAKLGQRLKVPVEAIADHAEFVQGLRTLAREALFVAKMAALLDRPDSLPGEKDRRELWQLLTLNPVDHLDFALVGRILAGAGWSQEEQAGFIEETFNYLAETDTLRPRDRPLLKTLRTKALTEIRAD